MLNMGVDMRQAIREADRLGCSIRIARKTGEYVVEHPHMKRIRCNCRRKDAPKKLVAYLNKVAVV